MLDDIIKMYEKQNNDKKYTIDKANVIAAAKKMAVVNEKENAMEVRALEERDLEAGLEQSDLLELE